MPTTDETSPAIEIEAIEVAEAKDLPVLRDWVISW